MLPSNSVDVHSVTDEKSFLDRYRDVFTGLGFAKGEYTKQLDESIAFFLNGSKS